MNVVSFLAFKERREKERAELLSSIAGLFARRDELRHTAIWDSRNGEEFTRYSALLRDLEALLQLECSMAISLGLTGEIMKRARSYHDSRR